MEQLRDIEKLVHRNYEVDPALWDALQRKLPGKKSGLVQAISIFTLVLLCALPFRLDLNKNAGNLPSAEQIEHESGTSNESRRANSSSLLASSKFKTISTAKPSSISVLFDSQNNRNTKGNDFGDKTVQDKRQKRVFYTRIEPRNVPTLGQVPKAQVIVQQIPKISVRKAKKWEFISSLSMGSRTISSRAAHNSGHTHILSSTNSSIQGITLFFGAQRGPFSIETGLGHNSIQNQIQVIRPSSIEVPLYTVINPNYRSGNREVLLIRIHPDGGSQRDTLLSNSLEQSAQMTSIPLRMSLVFPITNRISFGLHSGAELWLRPRRVSALTTDFDSEALDLKHQSMRVHTFSQIGLNFRLNSHFRLSSKLQMSAPGNKLNSLKINGQFISLQYKL